MAPIERFGFRFAPAYRLPGLLFGVTPRTAEVVINGSRLGIRFGPWRLESDLANIIGTEMTGPYSLIKTVGPAHLSLADRGITFATTGERGVCIRFRVPVAAMDPFGILRHPAATVTVTDPERLAARLTPPEPRTGKPASTS
ncbi:MAG: hypothetical protein ACRDYA_22190 [Egibacteraceae bacterium]